MSERPVDIRELTEADDYWQSFEHKWTALLTYRYLGKQTPGLDTGVDAVVMPLRHDMRNASGGIMVSPLCIASPESGGMADDLYVPNPVIASMHVLDDARDVRAITVDADTIKIGRSMGFSHARILDADDPSRVIALSEGMGVSLGGTPGTYQPVENPPVEVVDSPDLPPLHQVFGASRRDSGIWQLGELVEEFASPDAALHLGPQHVVLETAAAELAEAISGEPLQIESWHVMFVARGKVGPFRASGDAFPGNDGRVGVRLALYDEGNGDRVVTSATALFRPAG
jgi:hypothetical protein